MKLRELTLSMQISVLEQNASTGLLNSCSRCFLDWINRQNDPEPNEYYIKPSQATKSATKVIRKNIQLQNSWRNQSRQKGVDSRFLSHPNNSIYKRKRINSRHILIINRWILHIDAVLLPWDCVSSYVHMEYHNTGK